MKQQYEVEVRLKLNGTDVMNSHFSGTIDVEFMRHRPSWQLLLDNLEAVNSACRKLETADRVRACMNYESD